MVVANSAGVDSVRDAGIRPAEPASSAAFARGGEARDRGSAGAVVRAPAQHAARRDRAAGGEPRRARPRSREAPNRSSSVHRYLRADRDDTERCKVVLRDLHAFARRPDPTPRLMDLNQVCGPSRGSCATRRCAGGRAAARRSSAAACRRCWDRRDASCQAAAARWLLNAIDASPPGGQVTLATQAAEDGHVALVVSDEGEGIHDVGRGAALRAVRVGPPGRDGGSGSGSWRASASRRITAGRSVGEPGSWHPLRAAASARRGARERRRAER